MLSLSLNLLLISATHQIAVSIPPLQYILQEIVTEKWSVKSISSGQVSVHIYEPRPSEVKLLQSAELAFYVSEELDEWMVKYRQAPTRSFFSWISEMNKLRFNHPHGHADHKNHTSGEYDPHFWMDPIVVKSSVNPAVEFFCKLNPDECPKLRENGAVFSTKLDELHSRIQQKLAGFKGRSVMTTHHFLGYFCQRYELECLEPIEPTPGKEASPKDIIRLQELVKKKQLKTIFAEPQLSALNVDALAEASKVRKLTLDPQGVSPKINSYEELILWNLNQLVEGL